MKLSLLSAGVKFILENIPECLISLPWGKALKKYWQPLALPWTHLGSILPYEYKETQQYPTYTNGHVINIHLAQSVWNWKYCMFEVGSGGLYTLYKQKSWFVINSCWGEEKKWCDYVVQQLKLKQIS